jgi:hypothetical protein
MQGGRKGRAAGCQPHTEYAQVGRGVRTGGQRRVTMITCEPQFGRSGRDHGAGQQNADLRLPSDRGQE